MSSHIHAKRLICFNHSNLLIEREVTIMKYWLVCLLVLTIYTTGICHGMQNPLTMLKTRYQLQSRAKRAFVYRSGSKCKINVVDLMSPICQPRDLDYIEGCSRFVGRSAMSWAFQDGNTTSFYLIFYFCHILSTFIDVVNIANWAMDCQN